MIELHPHIPGAVTYGIAGCLLIAACSGSSPVAQRSSPTTAGTSAHRGTGASTARVAARRTGEVGSACSVITEHDVTGAAGADPGKGRPFASHGSTQCQFGSLPRQLLLVNITPARGRAGYDELRGNPKLTHGTGLSTAAVAGVGDRAFELTGPHTDAVYFTKGDALVVVGISGQSSPPKGVALALAKIAVTRL